MVTKNEITRLIDKTSNEFVWCWETLVMMKHAKATDDFRERIVNFQARLATPLARIDEMHRSLQSEKRKTVARKAKLSEKAFVKRMKNLEVYEKNLGESRAIGKALGDTFAWFFYINDRSHLTKHFKHPSTGNMPGGVGGRGELEFIRNVKVWNGHLVIYHETTNMLKIGDVSLIDLKTLKLAGIGELKSVSTASNQIEIQVRIVGGEHLKKSFLPTLSKPAKNPKAPTPLPQPMLDRLNRQIKKMSESFEKKSPDANIQFHQETTIDGLELLIKKLKKRSVAYAKCGDGLLLMGIKIGRFKSLSGRIIGGRTDYKKKFRHLTSNVMSIIDEQQAKTAENHNSLICDELNFDVQLGGVPLFWKPVPLAFVRQLLFREVRVQTIYNPAHLIRKLKKEGFEVEIVNGDYRNIITTKMYGTAKMEMNGWSYYRQLVTHGFMREETLIEMVNNIITKMFEKNIQPNSRVDLEIYQSFR